MQEKGIYNWFKVRFNTKTKYILFTPKINLVLQSENNNFPGCSMHKSLN